MSYIEGVTISEPPGEVISCDNGCISVRVTADLDDLFLTRGDNGITEIQSQFFPSAYQLRKLAEWANKTADDMEG